LLSSNLTSNLTSDLTSDLATARHNAQVMHRANPAALVQVLSQLEQLTDPVRAPSLSQSN